MSFQCNSCASVPAASQKSDFKEPHMSMDRLIITFYLILFCGFANAADKTDLLQQSDAAGTLKNMPEAIQNLLAFALSKVGLSYRRGGDSPESGFDCSGFVLYVFDRVEGIELPHSSNDISQIGNRIEKTKLLPGDLVFFQILHHAISHVGIYLGNGQFIHASSSSTGNVVISNLNASYWAKHFALARRVELPAEQSDNISKNPLSLQLTTSIAN